MSAPTINAVWIGSELSPLSHACMASFVRAGHKVVLHAFEDVGNVPQDVERFSASRLMTRSELASLKQNLPLAAVSDIYRLRILRENLGAYVDCDVFCVRPLPDDDYLLGWEDNRLICNAVLRMPANSELLRTLMQASENPAYVPEWWSHTKRFRRYFRRNIGRKLLPAGSLAWGVLGPQLLTHTVRKLNLEHLVKPIDYFYPVHYTQKQLLFEPDLDIHDVSTRRSFCIHLWESADSAQKVGRNSVLANLLAE